MQNYLYDLPTEIIDIINQKVLDEYRKEHAKLMDDTLETISEGKYQTEMMYNQWLEDAGAVGDRLVLGLQTGLQVIADFQDFKNRGGYSHNEAWWRWLTIDQEDGWSQVYVDERLDNMQKNINIKYADHMTKDHDVTEFIVLIKLMIRDRDDTKQIENKREKEYLLYLIQQKEEAANKGYLLNNDIINYMDMPNPI